MSQLLQNALYVPEDDVYLVSSHQHDFVTHSFKDGFHISVDGGREYARREGDMYKLSDANRYVEYCLSDEDPIEVILDRLLWGSHGKDGKQPVTFRPIKDLELDHLKAIIATQDHLSPIHAQVIQYWIGVKSMVSAMLP